jgi:MFS family permease
MTLASYWQLIRGNRNVRLLWSAQIVSELGDWFYQIAIFSFLLELTGSAQLVSFAFLMQVLPQVLVSPAAGVINDRLSRRIVMLTADWARALIVLSMILVRSKETLWLLYLLLALETVCWAMFEPASRAVIPNIAKPQEVPIANALSSATWSVCFAAGAAVGGIAEVAFGRNTMFVLNSLSFAASAFFIRRMRFQEPHAQDRPPLRASDLVSFSDIAEGLRYVRRDPKLFASIFVKAGAGLLGANWVILPLLGERVFPIQLAGLAPEQARTLGMSALLGSRGIGALFGAVAAAKAAGSNVKRLRTAVLVAFVLAGIGYAALGLADSLVLAVLAVLVAHAGGSAAWTSSTMLLQQLTGDRFRGRVFSTEFALSMLTLSVSSLAAGQLADRGIDARPLATATGMVMIVPAVAWWATRHVWRHQ